MFQRSRIKLLSGVAALISTFALALAPMVANADASVFHLGYYTPSQHGTLLNGDVIPGNGLASFNFTSSPNVALLVADQRHDMGDLLGKSVSATFDISGLNPGQNFTYYGEPDGSGLPATVRFYFQTTNQYAGGFAYTNYWWSNPVSVALNGNGTFTIPTVSFDPANWSDWNGHPGTYDAATTAAFNQAASNVTRLGMSFGGGYFFENGVGTTDGSGTFTLDSFSTQ